MGREPETPNREESMIFHAIEFAARTHSDRYRKGSRVPCFVHPMNAAKILIEYGCPGAVVVAGILPDATEDTSVTIAEIGKKFGEKFDGLPSRTSPGLGRTAKAAPPNS
jgi:(p)ppGpp synthase/HD superfamily hydrolase